MSPRMEYKVSTDPSAEAVSLPSLVDPVKWITDERFSSKELRLFNDAAQLYELQLSRMEFLTLGNDLQQFGRRTAYFEEVMGRKSDHFFLSSVRGKGQIGHSNQYLTHWFYPYKGKFHGQMVKALINFMGVPEGGLVIDPFVGSGTTLVECATLGIQSLGIEINPALCMVSQTKGDALTIHYPDLEDFINSTNPTLVFKYFRDKEVSLAQWPISENEFGTDAQVLLEKVWTEYFPPGMVRDLPFKWRNVLLVCFMHAHSDYSYLMGTNKAMSLDAFFIRDLNEYMATLEGTYEILNRLDIHIQPPRVLFGTALDIPLASDSVDGIVTSPPYSIALDYVKNDAHLLRYMNMNTSQLRQAMVGLRGSATEKLRLYEKDMKRALEEMRRVLRPGAHAAILLGDVTVGSIRTNFCDRIVEWWTDMGGEALSMRRPILGGYARLRYEHIMLLRK